jgi:hypothetical protein
VPKLKWDRITLGVSFLLLAPALTGCGSGPNAAPVEKKKTTTTTVLGRGQGDSPIVEYCTGIQPDGFCDISVDESHTAFGFKLTAKPGRKVAFDWHVYCSRGAFEDTREGTVRGTGTVVFWREATVKDATYCTAKAYDRSAFGTGRKTLEVLGR